MTTEKVFRYKLGDRVAFSNPLRRKSEFKRFNQTPSYANVLVADKTWEPFEYWNLKAPVEGIVVGKRVIYDGEAHYGYEDNPTTFTPTKSHTVYEIAYNLRLATVYVRPEDLTFIEGSVPE